MQKTFLMILDGPMGAGKSTVAKALHLQLDRTALLSWDDLKWMVNNLEDTAENKNLIVDIRLEMAKKFLSSGFNVIVEGGFSKKERLMPLLKLADELSAKCFKYFLTASEEILLKRALARPKPETEKEKISEENILKNIQNHPERMDSFELVDTNQAEADVVIERILLNIRK
ncbi:MAG TPA: ATP-binding protein [Candidatus Moranbacteria bacterium]|jgi:predicted kinase|nr:ATP-binding protein [Candidatus Moranbacteria bacterium]HQB59534.1 ATP-binding protein [Candidatus Moranbacteria bacterium]